MGIVGFCALISSGDCRLFLKHLSAMNSKGASHATNATRLILAALPLRSESRVFIVVLEKGKKRRRAERVDREGKKRCQQTAPI